MEIEIRCVVFKVLSTLFKVRIILQQLAIVKFRFSMNNDVKFPFRCNNVVIQWFFLPFIFFKQPRIGFMKCVIVYPLSTVWEARGIPIVFHIIHVEFLHLFMNVVPLVDNRGVNCLANRNWHRSTKMR